MDTSRPQIQATHTHKHAHTNPITSLRLLPQSYDLLAGLSPFPFSPSPPFKVPSKGVLSKAVLTQAEGTMSGREGAVLM